MQVSVETCSGLERKLRVGVPAERIDKEVNTRLQKAAPNVRLDGFRPGKVPMRVVRQRFGAGVRQEVVGEVLNQTFMEAVQQQELKPAGQPDIDIKSMEDGTDLEYTATFEVYPEFEIIDGSALALTRLEASVLDSDVDDMVKQLRKQRGSWEATDRAAKDGDQVLIDYTGTKDGEPFEGGTAENSTLELGSKRMIDGFENAVEGMKKGDSKTVSLQFPDDYHAEELKGAAVEFAITLHEVQEHHDAELNDELFKQFGVEEGGEPKFREELRSNLERELERAKTTQLKNQVMEALLEKHELTIPKALVNSEINVLREQSLQQFGGNAANFDSSLLPDELFAEQAERRVKLGLILGEHIKQHNVQADADKVRALIEEQAQGYEDPQEIINWYYSNQANLESVEAAALEEQVMDLLISAATVTDKASSYTEVMEARSAQ